MRNKKYISVAMSAMATVGAAIGFASCSNELTPENPGNSNDGNNGIAIVTPVKAPDFVAWSGNQILGSSVDVVNLPSSYAAQPNANQWGTADNNGIYQDFPRPNDITSDELAAVLAVFNQKGAEKYEPLVDWDKFFVQQVYCGPEGEKMTELAAWDPVGYEMTTYPEWNNWQPYTETVYDDIVNNFNQGAYSGNKEQGCMLMFDSSTTNWSFKSTQGGGERFYNWRMEYIPGYGYYVGFDFQSNKQGSDANENEYFERDYVYNDWIIKIVPGVGYEFPEISENPEPETPENPEPENPSIVYATNEVEVNLAINDLHDYDIADLVSKLSIHVRAPYDVEVLLPVQKEIYCDQDDLYIFETHEILYQELNHDVTYNVNGNEVTLNVEFIAEGEGAIKVTTEGINKDVIDYCQAQNGDGINFEVYNYYNRGGQDPDAGHEVWSIGDLKAALDQSTIKFFKSEESLEEVPDYYINAFTETIVSQDDEDYYRDCYVTPTEEYINYFFTPFYGLHLNGKDVNLKYCGKHVTVDPKEGDVTNHDRFGVNALR